MKNTITEIFLPDSLQVINRWFERLPMDKFEEVAKWFAHTEEDDILLQHISPEGLRIYSLCDPWPLNGFEFASRATLTLKRVLRGKQFDTNLSPLEYAEVCREQVYNKFKIAFEKRSSGLDRRQLELVSSDLDISSVPTEFSRGYFVIGKEVAYTDEELRRCLKEH